MSVITLNKNISAKLLRNLLPNPQNYMDECKKMQNIAKLCIKIWNPHPSLHDFAEICIQIRTKIQKSASAKLCRNPHPHLQTICKCELPHYISPRKLKLISHLSDPKAVILRFSRTKFYQF